MPCEQLIEDNVDSTPPSAVSSCFGGSASEESAMSVPEDGCGCPPRRKKRRRRPSCGRRRKKRRARRSCGSRRKRSRKRRPRRCIRPGRKTKNGYLNFLREFRKRNCCMSGKQAICEGAKCWNRLTRAQKCRYAQMARRRTRRKKRRC